MAKREVITLNEETPQLEVPQTGDSYIMPRDVEITGNLSVSGTVASSVADGASAVAFDFDTDAAYSTDGAKLLSLSNNGTERVAFDYDGALTITTPLGVSANKKLINIEIDSVSKFSVDEDGDIIAAGGKIELSNQGVSLGTGGVATTATQLSKLYLRFPRNPSTDVNIEFNSKSSDDATQDLVLNGLSAWASATTNITGGGITLTAGDGASGSAGQADGGNITLTGGTGYGTGSSGKVVFTDGLLSSSVADGATAVAFDFDTDNAYSTSGAKLLSLSNNGSPVYEFHYTENSTSGGLVIGPNATQNAIQLYRDGTYSCLELNRYGASTKGLKIEANNDRGIISKAGTIPIQIRLENQSQAIHLYATNNFDQNIVAVGPYLDPIVQDSLLIADVVGTRERNGSTLTVSGGDAYDGTTVDRDGGSLTLKGGAAANAGSPGKVVFSDGLLSSSVADGATAVAFDFDTDNAYSTSGAKLLSLSNNGDEKLFVDKDGLVNFAGGLGTDITLSSYYGHLVIAGEGTNWSVGDNSSGNRTNYNNLNDAGILWSRLLTNDITISIDTRSVDAATSNIILNGQAAQPTATTNLTGGNISITGGAGASSSAGAADGGNVNIAGGTGYGTGSNGKVVFTDGLISSSVADGATAVAFDFDTDAAYSTAGAKLASWSNNGTEKFAVDKDGYVTISENNFKVANPVGTLIDVWLQGGGRKSVVVGGQFGGVAANNNTQTALGHNHTANAGGCLLLGYQAVGNKNGSMVLSPQATNRGIGDHYGGLAVAGTNFAAAGDNQLLIWQPAATTTDATPAILYMDEDAAANRMDVASGKLYAFEAHIVGVQSDGTDGAYYIHRGMIANNSGTTALIGSVNEEVFVASAATAAETTADDTNDALQIQVTGVAAETWRWSANVFVKDITIGT